MIGQSLEAVEIREILRLLPHRYPFVMVDRIIEINGNQSGIGIKNVTINEPYFEGHFPGHPIMPGVLIIEAMVGGELIAEAEVGAVIAEART